MTDSAALTIVDAIVSRAAAAPDGVAFRYAVRADRAGGIEVTDLTCAGLHRRAAAMALALRECGDRGDRVLLLAAPGLDYVVAFFACMYAGMVPVPAYPPGSNRHLGRISGIVEDSGARLILGEEPPPDVLGEFAGGPAVWMDHRDLGTDRNADDWTRPGLRGTDLAFLQYTSGSVAAPKGVMVRHENLTANCRDIASAFSLGPDSVGASWLPPYHDMGLIGTICAPVLVGMPLTLMTPAAFVRDPALWLDVVTQHRVTHTAGPNFAYRLCADRVSDAALDRLDLSSWTHALNGAEPVAPEALDAFAARFASRGFRPQAFKPCYGLAENTLLVSGVHPADGPHRRQVDATELEDRRLRPARPGERSRTLVSCGAPTAGSDVVVVAPDGQPLPDETVGEVWVRGGSVAAGYYNKPDVTAETFAAQVPGDERHWLRTGDLGVLSGGELYLCGRVKDLIIVNGRNIAPQDVETVAAASHLVLAGARCAAFQVERNGIEGVVVVQAVPARPADESVCAAVRGAVRRAVGKEFTIPVHEVVLVAQRALPTTSSGKIQRLACRAAYLAGELTPVTPRRSGRRPAQADEVRDVLRRLLSEHVGLRDPDLGQPMDSYGLDSLRATAMAGQLSEQLGISVPASFAWDHPTLDALAVALAAETGADAPAAPSPAAGVAGTPRMAPALPRGTGSGEPVVVAGVGCRFPSANGPREFWELLLDGSCAVGEVPGERWSHAAFHDPDPAAPGRTHTRQAAFLSGHDDFDATLFGLHPREAAAIDPQQRLLLETTWHALEDAGIAPDSLRGSATGVYIAVSGSDFERDRLTASSIEDIDAHTATGSATALTANRLSYLLGLTGPSLVVDTACSSALVALDLATTALRKGQITHAVVGAANLMLTPHTTVALSKAGMLSPTGRCHTFDASADGYVRGEGVGVVILTREQVPGVRPRALVRGTAVNQDGRSSGLTAPSGAAQRAVISAALADAGIEPHVVGYVEAHGTGTPLGDPIEVNALHAAYADARRTAPLTVASVKTNIGHLEAAAGMAGLIKTILSLEYAVIPAHLGFDNPSPAIDWAALNLRVPTTTTVWPGDERVAGVSSFGFGGTNAHAILSSADALPYEVEQSEPAGADDPLMIKLSAADPETVAGWARTVADHLAGRAGAGLTPIAWVMNKARADLPFRTVLPVRSRDSADGVDELIHALRHVRADDPAVRFAGTVAPSLALVLTDPVPASGDPVQRFDALLSRCRSWLTAGLRPAEIVVAANVPGPALAVAAVLAAVFPEDTGRALAGSWGAGRCGTPAAPRSPESRLLLTGWPDAVLDDEGWWAGLKPAAQQGGHLTRPVAELILGRAGVLFLVGDPTQADLLRERAEQTATRKTVVDDRGPVTRVAAALWQAGLTLDWGHFTPRPATPAGRLPGYPFRHPHRAPQPAAAVGAVPAPSPVPGLVPSPVPGVVPSPAPGLVPSPAAGPAAADRRRSLDELLSYLQQRVAQQVRHPRPAEIDLDSGMFDLGLTSVMASELRARIQDELGVALSGTAVFEHPTIRAMATHLAAQPATAQPATTQPATAASPAAMPPATATPPAVSPIGANPSGVTGDAADNRIAVIGLGCRFPGGADSPESFWDMLTEAGHAAGPVPSDRWPAGWDTGLTEPIARAVRHGGFLRTAVDGFDAAAFSISPREALYLDPQQRLLLEVVWEALEDAGVPLDRVRRSRTGVFVGLNTADYLHLLIRDGAPADPYVTTGNTASVAAGRLSFFLGAQGPSLAVDTACSSSLVATHLAMRSLRSGECDLAIVAGVNLMLDPATSVGMARLGALAADGRCKTFADTADGYGRGEGCGALVLARMPDAVDAGDRVWAGLLGSATNQDGSGAGLTVPNGQAQEAVIRAALADAGVAADAVSYLEAHGTGTPLGDPIELEAAARAFGRHRAPQAPALVVGSAKANVGHLEAAAGVCGLVKLALMMRHRHIPPHPWAGPPNTVPVWAELGIRVADPQSPAPGIAGISSFGFGGTNAHVLVGPPPGPAGRPVAVTTGPHLVVASARTAPALRQRLADLRTALAGPLATTPIAEVARMAGVGRSHLPHRAALVMRSHQDADRLDPQAAAAPGRPAVRQGVVRPQTTRRLVWVFTGQGSQWAGMGTELLAHPVAGPVLRECADFLQREAGMSLYEELTSTAAARLDDTAVAQPAIFAVEAALVAVWRDLGLHPDAVVGHSVGEVAAAYAIGALDLHTALALVTRRGQVMAAARGRGAMAAVGLSEPAVRACMDGLTRVFVAAVNSPVNTVVAGDPQALATVRDRAREQGAWWAPLQSEYAFHSPVMAPFRADLIRALDGLTANPGGGPITSTVVAAERPARDLDAGYWADNVVLPVRFADALTTAVQDRHAVILEIGPTSVLGSSVEQTLAGHDPGATVLTSMRRGQALGETLLNAAAGLFTEGYDLDHSRLHGPGPRAGLPRYPWQRERYWAPDATRPVAPVPPAVTAGTDDDPVYETRWVELPGTSPSAGAAGGTWLLVTGAAPTPGLAEAFERHGVATRVLVLDDPGTTGTDVLLARALSAAGPAAGIVLDLPGFPGWDDPLRATAVAGDLLPAAVRAVADAQQPALRIWLLCRGGSALGAGVPAQAIGWGLGRVAALEHPGLWGGMADLDPQEPAGDLHPRVARHLLSGSAEDEIAVRSGTVLAPRLQRVRIADLTPRELTIRPDGTYLVTGGRGSLGLRLARWLAGRGARHLVLLGRTPVADDPADPVAQAVARLRRDGVRVHTPDADVTDVPGLTTALTGPWPPIRGVFHAAGVFDPVALRDVTPAGLAAVVAPKLSGALALRHVLSTAVETGPIDVMVLFSSAAAVWGSALAGPYAAANHALDVIAQDPAGPPTISIDWGWWESSTMGAHGAEYFGKMGLSALSEDRALDLLARVMPTSARQLLLAPVDWRRFLGVMEARRPRPLFTRLRAEGSAVRGLTVHAARIAAMPSHLARTAAVRTAVHQHVAAVLGLPEGHRLDADHGFFDAGMDSLMAMELKNTLEQVFGLELPATAALEHPTVTGLTGFLLSQIVALHPAPLVPGQSRSGAPAGPDGELSEQELVALLDRELSGLDELQEGTVEQS
ncbi:type I polyketide synthase [Actinoplanes sp. N902-109]|uniref:type I polyketide synthase n=1 Tax=Actinoplanes sp. (strain N902-109) TaxID=649831 RepID=UPI00032966C0|nr:type I polyketide synthase [Actinoplanes sp. N902-109]AGL16390.1 MxaC [Actinoplanes sp. N902-109]